MGNDLQLLQDTFRTIGVKFETLDERKLERESQIPGATTFISATNAHFHFDADGKFLGSECDSDHTFIAVAAR